MTDLTARLRADGDDEAADEIERLRAALKQISMSADMHGEDQIYDPDAMSNLARVIRLGDMARAALEKNNG